MLELSDKELKAAILKMRQQALLITVKTKGGRENLRKYSCKKESDRNELTQNTISKIKALLNSRIISVNI